MVTELDPRCTAYPEDLLENWEAHSDSVLVGAMLDETQAVSGDAGNADGY